MSNDPLAALSLHRLDERRSEGHYDRLRHAEALLATQRAERKQRRARRWGRVREALSNALS